MNETGGSGSAPSYLGLLRWPGTARFVVPATIGRLPQAMFGVGTVLLVEGHRDSYTLAGAVGAALALSGGVFAPVLGRLADRWGQSAVALGSVAVHVPALVGLVAATVLGAPAWALLLLGAVAGATTPILGAFSRVRWRVLTERRRAPAAWDRALALESVIDEVAFVVGPSLAALLAVRVSSALPLLVAAVVAGAGVVGFVLARETEPPPTRATAGRPGQGRAAVFDPGMPALVVVSVFIGWVFGGLEVGVIAFADEAGVSAAAGLLLSVLALASLVGGLAYGARRWSASPHVRLRSVAAGFGLTLLLVPWSGDVWTLGAALVLVGLVTAPTLIAVNSVVTTLVRPAVLTEGFTWSLVALLAGVAVGAATAGAAVDARGAGAALWVTAGAGALVLVTGWTASAVAARSVAARSVAARPASNPAHAPCVTEG